MMSKFCPAPTSYISQTPSTLFVDLLERAPLTACCSYGWLLRFRPQPMLPSQVYRFDPSTGQVQVVADQFVNPNGIAFTPDGKTAFV